MNKKIGVGFFVIFFILCILFLSCPRGYSDAEKFVKVTFNINYAGGISPSCITIEKGKAADGEWPENPSRLFHTFSGWFDGIHEYTSSTFMNADTVVSAKWERNLKESKLENQPSENDLAALFTYTGDTGSKFPQYLSNSLKIWGHKNPLLTQAFSADPYAMVYDDRVWIYASNDTILYDDSGNVKTADYGASIQGLRVISSADMVNWTDHGSMNFTATASTNPLVPTPSTRLITYANATWAPCCVWKEVNGTPKFFLYWCNTGNDTSVLVGDSPLGPWSTAGLTRSMINRSMKNGDSEWLFDPSVLIDDDGSVYMVLGGGGSGANPGNARRVILNSDMISIKGDIEKFNVPYLFEAQDLWKYKGVYYLSYCTNWNTGGNPYGFQNCEIVYMTSNVNPMDEWSAPKRLMVHALNSGDSNNHQRIFDFKDKVYITYHSQRHSRSMGLASGNNYRTAHIDNITFAGNGVDINRVTQTRTGIEQVGTFDPYALNEAETIAIQGGIYTRPDSTASNGMVVTSIDSGDWLGLYGVDFGSTGAAKFTAVVKMPKTPDDYVGGIEIRLDPDSAGAPGAPSASTDLSAAVTARISGGEVVGRVQLKAKPGEAGQWTIVEGNLYKTVTGKHNLVFVFYSSLGADPEVFPPTKSNDGRHTNGFEIDQWWFSH